MKWKLKRSIKGVEFSDPTIKNKKLCNFKGTKVFFYTTIRLRLTKGTQVLHREQRPTNSIKEIGIKTH